MYRNSKDWSPSAWFEEFICQDKYSRNMFVKIRQERRTIGRKFHSENRDEKKGGEIKGILCENKELRRLAK